MRLATNKRPRLLSAHIPRDREAGLPHDFSEQDWHYALDYWGNACAICGRDDLSIARDHWYPLNNKAICPGTIPTNIIPLCHGRGGCNNLKSDKNPLQWLRGYLGREKAQSKLTEINAFFETVRKTRYDNR